MMTASTRFSARRAKHAAGAPCCDPSARYCAVGRLPAALVVQMITDRVAFGRFVCAPCAAFYNLPLAVVPLPVSVETLTPADVAAAAASVILAVQQQQQPRINFDALDSDDDDTQLDDAATVAPPADAVPAVNGSSSGNAIGSSSTTSWSNSSDDEDDDDYDEYTIIEPSNDGNDSSSSSSSSSSDDDDDDNVPTMTVEELAALRSTIPCRFLLKRNGGVCPFGDTCRYKHAVPLSGTLPTQSGVDTAAKQQQRRNSSTTQRRSGGKQQQPLCRQYVRTGRCNRGTSCGYEHSEESNYV
jgi:hypothetical protein